GARIWDQPRGQQYEVVAESVPWAQFRWVSRGPNGSSTQRENQQVAQDVERRQISPSPPARCPLVSGSAARGATSDPSVPPAWRSSTFRRMSRQRWAASDSCA